MSTVLVQLKHRSGHTGLMSTSRKPRLGGGSGTPGASPPRAAARGRPGVGTHPAGSQPGVGAHGPGSGRLTLGGRSETFLSTVGDKQTDNDMH